MLKINNLSVTLSRIPIVHNASLELPAGKLIALLGPNGAGKTTLIKAIAGLTPVTSGHITLGTTTITDWQTSDRVANGIVYLPQQAALFKELSVLNNLKVVFDYHPYWRTRNVDEFCQVRDELLNRVCLHASTHQKAGLLSGGQKRKLEVIRALLMQPRVLLCDEPFAGVDPKSIGELTDLFIELNLTKNLAILLSDHNVDQLLSYADYAYLMLDGTIITEGTSEYIRADKITRQRYLG